MKSLRQAIKKNRIFMILTIVYISLLSVSSFLACFFSFQQRKEELISQMDMTLTKTEQKYSNTVDNFWQIFMPLFNTYSDARSVLLKYFSFKPSNDFTPIERLKLKQVLLEMMLRDNQIEWIALYSDIREVNYIMYGMNNTLQVLPEDFPYLEKIATDQSSINIYELKSISDGYYSVLTYGIGSSMPPGMGRGKLIAGYKITALEEMSKSHPIPIDSLNYLVISDNKVVFDSKMRYEHDDVFIPTQAMKGISRDPNGNKIYVNSILSGSDTSLVYYTASWDEIFSYAHAYTPRILLIILAFTLFSMIIYLIMLNMISKEVHIIRYGLQQIGENNLDYRITTDFKQSGLPEIAESINNMADRLNENINRAYHYQLKQKEAELSELQSKFNPHFLYNTLEMIRGKTLQNGDADTADTISQLAAIFRGFVGSKTFIPLPEELTFCKRYLSLFEARYGDSVEILFDIDSKILKYGIIRNVLQPLIENYFIHGFDTGEDRNYILFRGKSKDDRTYTITVEDNGTGMTEEELENLNRRLQEPIHVDTKSYGLKNLHQRLQLFYGPECGLTVSRNKDKGLSIQITVLKMTCEDYEKNNG